MTSGAKPRNIAELRGEVVQDRHDQQVYRSDDCEEPDVEPDVQHEEQA
jgi:hypothetical protein